MLAYVFWHQRGSEFTENEYHDALISFHKYYNNNVKIEGYLGSMVVKVDNVPWSNESAYEDWYFIESSKILDMLNDSIVNDPNIKRVHDIIAKMARNGRGGLYKLLRGEFKTPLLKYAYWISKPLGLKYEDFYTEIYAFAKNLWRKQLAMSPLTEFVIFSNEEIDINQKFSPIKQKRELIYSYFN